MSNEVEKIRFLIKDKEVCADGVFRIGISLVRSTKTGTVDNVPMDRLGASELPYILHSLRKSGYADPSVTQIEHTGFGFPYRLDFEIYDNYPSLT